MKRTVCLMRVLGSIVGGIVVFTASSQILPAQARNQQIQATLNYYYANKALVDKQINYVIDTLRYISREYKNTGAAVTQLFSAFAFNFYVHFPNQGSVVNGKYQNRALEQFKYSVDQCMKAMFTLKDDEWDEELGKVCHG
ncbi:hypothetical protein [Psittacicella hinzii]|uniref:Uncharacterized protein n=1 Tax=Psittacicella hinzii TaxID=2028575 RepID=A0A3A1YC87_9GAMM|nr:hypothetical protein [Psittacicella hinzii]RIY35161.1 hypothetical protein CKF58_07000 [Psittacicella hinzii]